MMEIGELFSGRGLRRIRRGRRARPRLLRFVVGGKVGHVRIAEVLGERRHLRILPPPVAELDELPVREVDGLAGERRRPGNRGIPVRTMTRGAGRGLLPPSLEISRPRTSPHHERRRGHDQSEQTAKPGSRHDRSTRKI